MELFQVQHVTHSPHFPQYNGFAEAMVKILRNSWIIPLYKRNMELWSHGIQMYSTHREHSLTIGASNWSKTQSRSYFYTIKKQQMDISEELSISTYESGQRVWCFNTLDKIWKPAVILEPAPKPHSYWCRMKNSNLKLRRTWLYIKPHLNTMECEEKQMLSSTQMEENHTFQFAPAVDRNESSSYNCISSKYTI